MNQTVGQYRILALLGEGGMGAVYAAEDTLLDIKVALKSLRSELTKTPDMVERFREEAKIQVKLNSPHIVKLYTFMRDGQDYYMVMEFVEGRTLGSFIERVGRLNYRDAIQIMNQALDGLEHAHRLGVIHRDIKLNNIMITPEGTVKVMDFGIARVLGSRRLTRAGNIVGTLDYISPEALNGQEITPAADIYSCGIMLYKMVTGSLPFISENDYLLARMHVEVPPPPPSVHIPDLPRKLEEIILKALAKAPADRFQSAGQMAQALDQFLDASENRDQESSSPFWRRFTPGKSTPPPITGRGDGSGARPLGQRSGGGGSVSPAAATANRRIEELMTQNRMREALDLVQRSIQEFPDDTTLRDLRARIEREQRHYEEDLRRSASEIRGYLDRGLAEMALSAAETQLQRYSGEVSLLELLEEARRQVALKQQKAEAATLIEEEIRPLVEEGRFAEAIAIVVEAVSQNPDEPALTTLLGRTIKAQRDVEKRKQILECRQEAEQLASEGLFDQAIARIERTRLGQPDDPSLLTLLRQLLEARDAAKRRADLDRVTRKIDELEGAGRLDDADSALEVALRRFPREQKLQEKRREIQGKIAERKRQDGIRATRKNVALFKDSHDWTKALGELDLAVERLGPDPAFDEIRTEVRAGQKEYRQKVDAAANSVRDQMAAGELESAIVALEDLRTAYPREQIFVRLQLESSQALAEQQRRLRIRTLVEEADRLIAESKADQAAKLLADVPAGMAEVPEIRSAVERAADAKKAELRRAAEKAALDALQDFEKAEDWDGGAHMLAGVLADHPDIAGLEKKLHEFEAKAEAKRRALACGQAEAGCREDVRRLIERSEWTQALQRIDSTLAEFPEAAQLIAFRKEIDSQYASWTRTQQLHSAVADIERLLGSSRLDEAATAIEREWERFPEAETFLTLSLRLEQLREEEQNQQARRVAAGRASGLIAAHRWDEAASVLAEVEKRLGSDAEIARVRQLLEREVTAFQAAIGACKSEVDGLVRGNKWQEAVGFGGRPAQEVSRSG
jgi:serine/threonine protein kinase